MEEVLCHGAQVVHGEALLLYQTLDHAVLVNDLIRFCLGVDIRLQIAGQRAGAGKMHEGFPKHKGHGIVLLAVQWRTQHDIDLHVLTQVLLNRRVNGERFVEPFALAFKGVVSRVEAGLKKNVVCGVRYRLLPGGLDLIGQGRKDVLGIVAVIVGGLQQKTVGVPIVPIQLNRIMTRSVLVLLHKKMLVGGV